MVYFLIYVCHYPTKSYGIMAYIITGTVFIIEDRNRPGLRRSKLESCAILMDEQSNP